ncbi:MAG: glutaredoxin family protein [Acidobacteriota bacterium]|nr:glutaredoxin family protein [Acidobacteriota bacterium]MDQ5872675.1 glutaredoxin family protein [Acidobacteriota bacterium]
MIQLTLLSRPGCHLCEEMRREVDALLAGSPHEWDVIDVGTDPDLLLRYGDSIPVLFVNGRLFAKIRLPRFSSKVRLLKATSASL